MVRLVLLSRLGSMLAWLRWANHITGWRAKLLAFLLHVLNLLLQLLTHISCGAAHNPIELSHWALVLESLWTFYLYLYITFALNTAEVIQTQWAVLSKLHWHLIIRNINNPSDTTFLVRSLEKQLLCRWVVNNRPLTSNYSLLWLCGSTFSC